MCNVSVQQYVAASASGMLLCQSLHAYIGSTLRSMEEVVSSSSSSTAAYVVFGGQVCDFTCTNLLHLLLSALYYRWHASKLSSVLIGIVTIEKSLDKG